MTGDRALDGVGVGPSRLCEGLRKVVAARHPEADLGHLHDIAVMAAECHRGQRRRSGDQYVTHPLIVATYVAEWGRSLTCIHAAMLHDVLVGGWDPSILRGSVDDRVVELIEALYLLERDGVSAVEMTHPELAEDMLALKLADRMHNARTWCFVPTAKVRRRARETIDVLVPVAGRAGLNDVGAELEHLARAELAAARDRPASSTMMVWALNRLPAGERVRYEQEWSADLRELRTRRERWMFGLGLLWSARHLR